ncbi:glycosyltransferase family 2 protein [Ruminococcus flavefaciens]|uniref:Glycosyltransferase involved in cell wall bisynthesis n=1 Tax=Ruminococcus flavefaciens TaxID=1265 RepID=A0A1K1MV46_RUMFL|nr:glycosyltransferase family 2 protein [Ruminococcus flavefaciens]SFW27058.1 Glycosyltransferase involved in cell wall bisynthesis [Ruminococcus flavefaciens]
MAPEKLYMVVPCYNEQEVLPETSKQLRAKYTALMEQGLISRESRIVFVNDGSSDKTWSIIQELHSTEPQFFSGIDLAHNSGHQNAVLAGLMTVKDICDMCITMDADLQDDINTIDEMVRKYYEGNQVVYGVRSARDTDTFFKKTTAEGFYKFMKVMGADVIYNHADFRLMSSRVLQELANFKEVNLFLRGMVPLIGFQNCKVYYERHERAAGESKYPLKKMLSFAINGITSFSTKPLKLITGLGLIMSAVSIIAFIWAFITKIVGFTEHGWSSTMCSIWLIGGLQLFCLGIIGEYIGKIYAEVKQRPRYIVAEFLSDVNEKEKK